ncbi:MAG TPA: hypothetical protein VLL48_13275, partial [Longimicrobiales bacterium]|nr:hypothetical protein [Longimicrobiales bacterium]
MRAGLGTTRALVRRLPARLAAGVFGRPRLGLVAPALLALAAAALAPGTGEAQSDPPYEAILFQEGVRVETRDGTGLATDVFRPARGGRALEGPF